VHLQSIVRIFSYNNTPAAKINMFLSSDLPGSAMKSASLRTQGPRSRKLRYLESPCKQGKYFAVCYSVFPKSGAVQRPVTNLTKVCARVRKLVLTYYANGQGCYSKKVTFTSKTRYFPLDKKDFYKHVAMHGAPDLGIS